MKGLQSFVNFSAIYYGKTAGLCGTILITYALVWMSWHFYKLAAGIPSDLKQVIEDLTRIIAGTVFLQYPAYIFELYTATLKVGVWAAGQAYSATDGSIPQNMGELVCFATNGVDHALLRNITTALPGLSILQLEALIWTLIIFIPVALLMLRILKHVSEPLLDVSLLFVLLPFTVLAASIGPLAGAAMQSIKLLITSMKQLVVASTVVGVMMSMLNEAYGWSPVSDGIVDISSSSKWLGSQAYFMTLAMIFFFYYSFDRAMEMPGRLFSMFTPRSTQYPGLPVAGAAQKLFGK